MSKNVIAAIAIGAVVLFVIIGWFGMSISYTNAEHSQRNLIVAKQKANKISMDTMVKTISQTAQVTEEQMASIKEIIMAYTNGRKISGGSLATMVHEAVPNLDTSTATFRNLQNIIVASRNSFQRDQDELLDMNRVHDNMIDNAPSRWFVSGGKIEVVIVTSSRVEASFKSGVDDDDSVFKK